MCASSVGPTCSSVPPTSSRSAPVQPCGCCGALSWKPLRPPRPPIARRTKMPRACLSLCPRKVEGRASRQRFPRIKGKQLPDRQPRAHAAPPAPASTGGSRSPSVFGWAPGRMIAQDRWTRGGQGVPEVRSPGYAGSPFGMGGTRWHRRWGSSWPGEGLKPQGRIAGPFIAEHAA